MLVHGFLDSLTSRQMLRFLNLETIRRVLLIAQHQCHREGLAVGRSSFFSQPILMRDLVVPGQLIDQAHWGLVLAPAS